MGSSSSKSSSTMGSDSKTRQFIQSEVDANKIVVWSKSYCPYCTQTKQVFSGLGVNAVVYELDREGNGSDIQSELHSMTGQRTVPSVFVNGKHLGGNDDTQSALRTGELARMLAA